MNLRNAINAVQHVFTHGLKQAAEIEHGSFWVDSIISNDIDESKLLYYAQ